MSTHVPPLAMSSFGARKRIKWPGTTMKTEPLIGLREDHNRERVVGMRVASVEFGDLPGVVHIFFDEDAVLAADVKNVAKVDPAQALSTVQGHPTARKACRLKLFE